MRQTNRNYKKLETNLLPRPVILQLVKGAAKRVIRKFQRIVRQTLKRIIFDSNDHRQTVFLAGTGRSGTTWIAELINTKNDFRLMFEPFHSNKIDLLSDWNFRQYLRPSDRNDKYLKPATAILSGNIRSDWIDKYNRRLFSRKRLIKDIRAQHILRWIYINFPEIPIVLLLRHPCAVANSKLKLGWDTHLQDFLVQDALMEDFLNPFKSLLQTAKNNFEKHILMWCVENYVPLKQFSEGEILIVFYEDICRNPKQEIQRILAFIGEEFSPAFNSGFSKPSAESRKESAIVSGSDLIGSWRESISDDQTARSVEILGVFGLHEIYNESEFPLLTGAEVLKLFRH